MKIKYIKYHLPIVKEVIDSIEHQMNCDSEIYYLQFTIPPFIHL